MTTRIKSLLKSAGLTSGPFGWVMAATISWAFALMTVIAATQGATAQGQAPLGQDDLSQGAVGIAFSASGEVTAKRGIYTRAVTAKDEIFQNERIETGSGAAVELVLRDNTRISLGPKSSVVIDKVVWDANPMRRKISVTATSGTMRFTSGNSPSSVYEVKTPTGQVGVKGTEFLVIIGFNGVTTVAVERGTVLFSNNAGESVVINKGQASSVAPAGAGGAQAAPSQPNNTSDAIANAAQRHAASVNEARATTSGGGTGGQADRDRLTGPTGGASGTGQGISGNVENVPAKAVQGALYGSDDGVKALTDFIRGDGGPSRPEDVARRAMSVLRELKTLNQTGQVKDIDQLVNAAERVAESASNIFNTGSMMKLNIDAQYRVPNRAIALDLEPPDSETAAGWESVVPRDKRIQGQQMRGFSRPGGDPLTNDGILGVSNVAIKVDNNLWRVVVMTQDVGTPLIGQDTVNYLGDQLQINETSMSFKNNDPKHWYETSYLTNKKIDVGTYASEGAATTAQAGGDLIPGVTDRDAGVVVAETEVTTGAVDIILINDAAARRGERVKTYVVAILLEPIEQPSSVKGYPNITRFLELDKLISKQVAELVAEADPKAGKIDGNVFENDTKNPSPS